MPKLRKDTGIRIGKTINDKINDWLDQADLLGEVIIKEKMAKEYFPSTDISHQVLHQTMYEIQRWIKNHGITRYCVSPQHTQQCWILQRIN